MKPGRSLRMCVAQAEVLLDATRIPVVAASWSGRADMALVDRYFEEMRELVELLGRDGVKGVMVNLTSGAKAPSSLVRQRLAEHAASLREPLERVFVANAVVIENPMIRGTMTALGWLDPEIRAVPYLPSLASAREWARAELQAIGAELPAGALGEGEAGEARSQ